MCQMCHVCPAVCVSVSMSRDSSLANKKGDHPSKGLALPPPRTAKRKGSVAKLARTLPRNSAGEHDIRTDAGGMTSPKGAPLGRLTATRQTSLYLHLTPRHALGSRFSPTSKTPARSSRALTRHTPPCLLPSTCRLWTLAPSSPVPLATPHPRATPQPPFLAASQRPPISCL